MGDIIVMKMTTPAYRPAYMCEKFHIK